MAVHELFSAPAGLVDSRQARVLTALILLTAALVTATPPPCAFRAAERERRGTCAAHHAAGQRARETEPAANVRTADSEKCLTAGSSSAGAKATFWLPAYGEIGRDDVQEELQLSQEQLASLRAISAAALRQLGSRLRTLAARRQGVSQEQREAWVLKEQARIYEELAKAFSKRVEEVLTPKQLQHYKKAVFAARAYQMLHDPRMLEAIAATAAQRETIANIDHERSRELVAPRLQVQRGPGRRAQSAAAGKTPPGSPVRVALAAAQPEDFPYDTDDLTLPQPPYGDLERPAVRAMLGLSDTQEKRLHEVSASYRQCLSRFLKDSEKLSLEHARLAAQGAGQSSDLARVETKTGEAREALTKCEREVDLRIRDLLTAKQLAALRQYGFQNAAAALVFEDGVDKLIGISKEQEKGLRRIAGESQRASASIRRRAAESAAALLSAAQEQRLRKEIDGRAAW